MRSIFEFCKSFSEYISLTDFLFEEKTINFKTANPNYNQCVILAGGAASGKGFIQSKINLTGKVLDVDELKTMYRKLIDKGRIDDKYDYDLADPKDTAKLHELVSQRGWKNSQRKYLFKKSEQDNHGGQHRNERLPNVIFDMVSKNIEDIEEVLELAKPMGYQITIVWVITNTETAVMNNKLRGIGDRNKRRSVPEEVLTDGHKGAYKTMTDILSNKYENINQFIDQFYVGFGTGFGRTLKDEYQKSPVKKIRKTDGKWDFDKNIVDNFMKEPQPFNIDFCKACNAGNWDDALKAVGEKKDNIKYIKEKWKAFTKKYPEAKDIK